MSKYLVSSTNVFLQSWVVLVTYYYLFFLLLWTGRETTPLPRLISSGYLQFRHFSIVSRSEAQPLTTVWPQLWSATLMFVFVKTSAANWESSFSSLHVLS